MLPMRSFDLSDIARQLLLRLAIAGMFGALAFMVLLLLVPGFPPLGSQ
jgi:hypothetical protein